jgi:hypothetical protein
MHADDYQTAQDNWERCPIKSQHPRDKAAGVGHEPERIPPQVLAALQTAQDAYRAAQDAYMRAMDTAATRRDNDRADTLRGES